MKFLNLLMLISLVFLFSCDDLGKVRAKKNQTSGNNGLEAKDLSKMTTESAIKTKYKKIEFNCVATFEVENVIDGAIQRDSKTTTLTWNIKSNTLLSKTLNIEDKILNLTFSFKGFLGLSLDKKFNASVSGIPSFTIKTYASDGSILTSVISDGLKNPFLINENESIKVIDMLLDSTDIIAANKIQLTCKLLTEVNPEYRN